MYLSLRESMSVAANARTKYSYILHISKNKILFFFPSSPISIQFPHFCSVFRIMNFYISYVCISTSQHKASRMYLLCILLLNSLCAMQCSSVCDVCVVSCIYHFHRTLPWCTSSMFCTE